MKLLKCHIENFGKLSDFNYEFKDGLNTIKQENGFGKTTFASFIKAMFYGLETKKNTKALIDRKKYEPWQGGAFGGSIEIEVNSKKYKIERFFGKKEVDDTFKIYDLSTNLETEDFSQNIGEDIFKLNKEAYERSTFISGQNIETSMNDSINAKLGNILESENDINSSEKAIRVLDEAIKNYKKTGGRGEINEKIFEKTKLEQKLEQSKIDEKALQERKNKYEEIKKSINNKKQELEKTQKILTSQMQEEAKKIKKEQYKNLKNNLEESKTNLEQYKKLIDSDNELKEKIEFNKNKLENLNEKLTKLDKKIKLNKKVNAIFFILFLIFVIAGGILIFKQKTATGAIMVGISAISIIVFILKLLSLNTAKNNYINKRQEKLSQENLIETLNSLYKKQIEDQNRELARLNNEYEAKLKIKNDYEIENNLQELETINNEILYYTSTDKEEVEKQIKMLNIELNKLNDEKNYNKNQIEILESNLEAVFDVENELEEITQRIEEMKENCSILEKTKKYLQTAKEQFSTHYLSNMKNSFIKNINLINGENMDIDLDVNLNAKINEQGSQKELRYFSTGYKDLIYICMRLSLIDALFEEETPFIILDDPFVNLDEAKIENAINLLNTLSKNYQIIYFACHESRV